MALKANQKVGTLLLTKSSKVARGLYCGNRILKMEVNPLIL